MIRGNHCLSKVAPIKSILMKIWTRVRMFAVLNLIKQTKEETNMQISGYEAYQILYAVRLTAKIKGDIAEVGVYKGGSAKLICEAKGKRSLHLFDTFEGLPDPGESDFGHSKRLKRSRKYKKGEYKGSLEEVKTKLQKYPNVFFYKGLFPATAKPIEHKVFSFVNLDVDLYKSTMDALKFFYPKLSRGGIIISHDYNYAAGVTTAFDEFFVDKLEKPVKLLGSHVLIKKLAS